MTNSETGGVIVFRDREDAGQRLGKRLARESFDQDAVVLGLARGGVPVAFEVASALNAPMDVFVVRKLGAPFNPELAVGAIASGNVVVYNTNLLDQLGLVDSQLAAIREQAEVELNRRERKYRGGRSQEDLGGKCAILVDDGIATGATMRAAVDAASRLGAASIVVAAPTAAADSVRLLEKEGVKVITLSTPEPYIAVGAWYQRFSQLTDEQVIELLALSRRESTTELSMK